MKIRRKRKDQDSEQSGFNPAGLPIGVGIGVAFGVVFDQLAIGIAIGAGLGTTLCVILGNLSKDKSEKD
ncbi:hypothetical protein HQ585_02085 [candidate division KSB1 bacterium]|nr:hypothetical protein [candidate division KSB1 bacterium]